MISSSKYGSNKMRNVTWERLFVFLLLLFSVPICFSQVAHIHYRWQGASVMDMAGIKEYPAATLRLRNWGAATYVTLGGVTYVDRECRALIKPLGLADSLSGLFEDYRVGAAVCTLKVYGAPTASQTFYIYRLSRDWMEGIGTGVATGNCCWDSAANSVAWTTPGGDFASDLVDSFNITNGEPPVNAYIIIDLKSYVDSVFAGADDYGVIIVLKETGVYSTFSVYSDDATSQENAPIINIRMDYTYWGDGISPDTISLDDCGFYDGPMTTLYYDPNPDPLDTSAWHGIYVEAEKYRSVEFINCLPEGGNGISVFTEGYSGASYQVNRGIVTFNTLELPSPDSCKFLVWLYDLNPGSDSLYAVSVHVKDSACNDVDSAIKNTTNFYQCKNQTFDYSNVIGYWPCQIPEYTPILIEFDFDKTYFNTGDTTCVGFVTRVAPGDPPTFETETEYVFASYGDAAVRIIYWYTEEDTSGNGIADTTWHQDSWGLGRYALRPWGNRRW